jgi:hypothetical protein
MNATWSRRLRWSLAALVLVVGIAITGIGWRVCEDKLATTGSSAVARVCRPPTITDPPVAAGLFLVLLLLLPDLAEIGIPGFVTLKRRVEEQQARVEEQEAKLTELANHMAQVAEQRQVVTQQANPQASNYTFVSPNAVDVSSVLRELNAKVDDRPARTRSLGGFQDASDVTPDRARVEAQLLRLWAKLAALVALGRQYEDPLHRSALGEDYDAEEGHFFWLGPRSGPWWPVPRREDGSPDRDQLKALNIHHFQLAKLTPEDLEKYENKLDTLQPEERDRATFVITNLRNIDARQEEFRRLLHATIERYPDLLTENRPLSSDHELLATLARWVADFEPELEILQAAQQAVAKAQPIDDSKLGDYIKLAEGLLRAWYVRRNALHTDVKEVKEAPDSRAGE